MSRQACLDGESRNKKEGFCFPFQESNWIAEGNPPTSLLGFL
jgi:hypothetical protein